jgi:hypothetical protein
MLSLSFLKVLSSEMDLAEIGLNKERAAEVLEKSIL